MQVTAACPLDGVHSAMLSIGSRLLAEGHLSLVNDLTSSSRLFSLEKSFPAQKRGFTGDKEALLSRCGLVCSVCAQLILTLFPLGGGGAKLFFCLKKKLQYFFSEMVYIKVFIIPLSFCVKLMLKLERKWEAWQFR